MVANIPPVSSAIKVHFVNAIPKYLKFVMCSFPGCDFLLHFVSEKWSGASTYFSYHIIFGRSSLLENTKTSMFFLIIFQHSHTLK